jgi:hypothetical protein
VRRIAELAAGVAVVVATVVMAPSSAEVLFGPPPPEPEAAPAPEPVRTSPGFTG